MMRKNISSLRMRVSLPDGSKIMRLADWARLRVQMVWAYQGSPAIRHFDQSVMMMTTAWLLISGKVTVKSATAGTSHARAGQWIFPPSDKVAHDFSDDAELLSIVFRASWPDDSPLYSHSRAVLCDSERYPELGRAARQVVRVARGLTQSPGSDIRLLHSSADLKHYLDLLRATLLWVRTYDHTMSQMGLRRTAMGGGDPRIALVRQRIETMPFDQPFSETAAARSAGLSPSQLNRLFVTDAGMTPRAYSERRRIEFACHSLLDSAISVKEVAYRLGFRQPSHFSKWFKKKIGSYPTEFRRQNDAAAD